MKRAVLSVLMTALLCACSSSEKLEKDFEEWRGALDGKVSITARLTVSQDELVSGYELQYTETDEGCSVELLSPESIRGVTASKKGDDTQLEYDGLILSLGDFGGVSPVNAMPMLMETLRKGYVELCYTEEYDSEELLCVQFAPENGMTVRLWLSEGGTPQCAELEAEDIAGIKIAITDWNKS
jgi:hypothetical protein